MGVFDGLVFCISGKLAKSQKEIQDLVQKHGGGFAATVNKTCTHVIASELGSTKTKQAEDKGLPVVTEEWVDESVSLGKLCDDFALYLSGAPGGAKKADSKSKKTKKEEKEEEDEEEEEEEEVKPKKRARKPTKKKVEADEEEEDEEEKPKKKGTKRKADKGSDVFSGLTFCVSGKLSMSQAEVKALISNNGGSLAGSVTRAVTHVLAEDIGSSKTQNAVDKGLPVVREAWLHKSIEDGKLSTDADLFVEAGDGGSSDGPPAKKAKSVRAKKKKDDDDGDDGGDDDGGDDEPVKKAPKKAASSSSSGSSSRDEPKMKKEVVKGAAPVDTMSGKADSCHVFEEPGCVWDAMLNQTNISNNNNKYYIVQLLEDDNKKQYFAWNRWGRVGKTAGKTLVPCGSDLEKAKKDFKKKFKDKTKNDWDNRASFKPYNGKYTLLERDYKADAEEAEDEKGAKVSLKDIPDSKLDERVQKLIKLICDVEMMTKAMIEVGYDAKKLPLGRLSTKHIQKGYEVLKKISEQLESGKGSNLTALSNDFYTLIPHDFGMKQPPVISNSALLKQKLEMVEALADIQIATKLLKTSSGGRENPIDVHYQQLKCGIKPVNRASEDWEIIQEYVKNTHAKTHNKYGLKILDVFEMDREGEDARYGDHRKTENRMLLWHGSRLTNFVGIISQGLRIAPPEAPVTGYMFGKGVYFADMVSKSANYCNTTRDSNIGCLLLCEVALGKCSNKYAADYYADQLPKGCLSTKGVGTTQPKPSGYRTMSDGVVVPCGEGENVTLSESSSLLYNEFIVYNVNQVRIRYMVHMEFNYK